MHRCISRSCLRAKWSTEDVLCGTEPQTSQGADTVRPMVVDVVKRCNLSKRFFMAPNGTRANVLHFSNASIFPQLNAEC